MAKKDIVTITGSFRHLVYSPKGHIEGVLLLVDSKPTQFVLHHDEEKHHVALFFLEEGQEVVIEASSRTSADKRSGAVHPVFKYHRLLSIDGKKPAKGKTTKAPPFVGTVIRLNFARHGAPNGVVLDTGDFIHTKPEGFKQLKLKVGAKVDAEGEARPLVVGRGMAVEARQVNGKSLGK